MTNKELLNEFYARFNVDIQSVTETDVYVRIRPSSEIEEGDIAVTLLRVKRNNT